MSHGVQTLGALETGTDASAPFINGALASSEDKRNTCAAHQNTRGRRNSLFVLA